MERTGPGELRHLCEDDKGRSRGGRTAITADARSGRRTESSVVARWEFNRVPAKTECWKPVRPYAYAGSRWTGTQASEVSIPETGGFYSPYLAWTPDSQSLIVTDHASAGRPTALFLVSVRTGEKQQLTFPPSGVIGDHCPAVSPDGKSLAFRRAHAQGNWRGTIYLLGLDIEGKARGEPREVVLAPWVATPNGVFDWSCVAWTADSRKLVFFHDLGLWTQPLSPESRNPVRGQAVMAVEIWPRAQLYH